MKLPASLGRFISQLCRVSNIGLVSFDGYNKIVVKNVSIKLVVMETLIAPMPLILIVAQLLSIKRGLRNSFSFHKFCSFLQISVEQIQKWELMP